MLFCQLLHLQTLIDIPEAEYLILRLNFRPYHKNRKYGLLRACFKFFCALQNVVVFFDHIFVAWMKFLAKRILYIIIAFAMTKLVEIKSSCSFLKLIFPQLMLWDCMFCSSLCPWLKSTLLNFWLKILWDFAATNWIKKLLLTRQIEKLFQDRTVSTPLQKRKHVYRSADSELCFDQSGHISAIGVTEIFSRQHIPEKKFFVCDL